MIKIEYLRMVLKLAANECRQVAAIMHDCGNPNSIIGTDIIHRMNRAVRAIEDTLKSSGGELELPPDDQLFEEDF